MIPSGPHKFKNALSDSIIFLDKEFDLVLDVMRATSREVGRIKSVLSYRLTKIVSFCPDERATLEVLPNLTVD